MAARTHKRAVLELVRGAGFLERVAGRPERVGAHVTGLVFAARYPARPRRDDHRRPRIRRLRRPGRVHRGSPEAIARFNRAGIPVAVVTNQAGVARGLYGIDDVAAVHQHIAERLAEHGAHIDLFLYCPYHPEGVVEAFARTSEDRKPGPGMAKAAQAALNLDLTASWVVGDRPEDIGLARAVGASAIYLGPGVCRPAGRLVVPEPRRRRPVHPGAHCRMSSSSMIFRSSRRRSAALPAKFPVAPYASAASYFGAYAEEMARAAQFGRTRWRSIGRRRSCSRPTPSGAGVFACGNGGSAAIANHLQCDHVKGIRTGTDLPPGCMSLSTNVELLTAIANDIGYEDVFVYQLQSQARPGDVLIAVSSSGRSPNIVRALTWARDHGLRTIALTGFGGGDARAVAEVAIHVDGANYGIVEDLHQAHHARAGPVHPPVADDRGRDLVERCSESWQPSRPGVARRRHVPCRKSKAGSTDARGDQPADRGPGEPVGRPLVLDPGDPRDGQATGDRTRNCTCW